MFIYITISQLITKNQDNFELKTPKNKFSKASQASKLS